MSHPLQAARSQGKHGKAARTKAEVKNIKHRGLLVSFVATLEAGGVKALFESGSSAVKNA